MAPSLFNPQDLINAAGQLQKVATQVKEAGLDAKAVESMKKIYEDNKENLDALAEKTGSCLKKMKENPPKDASDFAAKILSGSYEVA